MSISASLVKDLREKTGAGMMDCKKALVETNGDFEAAVDWLRTKGLAAAAKKAGKTAAEGLTAVYGDNNGAVAVAIEVNSETDFVAKNQQFQDLVAEISEIAMNVNDLESLKESKSKSGKTVSELIVENIATIGENLNLRRMQKLSVQNGVVASYVHNTSANNMGKISALVALESTGDKSKLVEFGKQLAMHIVAAKPLALDASGVEQKEIERERAIAAERARESGKPEEMIGKIAEGSVRKFLESVVLKDQVFVIDGKAKVSEAIANFAKELGAAVEVKGFVRFELGEGIEKEEKNFADEVAAVVGK